MKMLVRSEGEGLRHEKVGIIGAGGGIALGISLKKWLCCMLMALR
ncbi:MAG: hypothetical protein CM15mP111_3930 [Hyphomicrobiales bacterium]|nr:MAG: hypothetical protein CM15mP111_3930 [Hyphomicrobiales bacterium]